MSIYGRWLAGAALVLQVAACSGGGTDTGISASPTPTAPPLFVAEHVGLSSDNAVESCLPIDAPSIAGRRALERAWNKATVKTDAKGNLCAVETVDACDGRGRWRHYIVDADGAQRRATLDPDDYQVKAGELDAWLYNPPGDTYGHIGITFAAVCEDELAGGSG